MCRTRCVLALVVLYVGLAQSWDFAASKGDLLEFYANGIKTDSVRFESKKLTALFYDEVHDIMLYVDKQDGNDAICGYGISSSEKKCFTEKNWREIHGLAFDPVTEKVFFSDTRQRSINWISLKPGAVNNIYGNLLFGTGDGIPTDIAVDSCGGYVYWISTNLTPPRIERARFDGSGREVVINLVSIDSPHKQEPHSLVIDQQTQRMFWVEPKTHFEHSLSYADLNGNNRQHLMDFMYGTATAIPRPSTNTLVASKSDLYWVDWCTNCNMQVWKVSKDVNGAPWSYDRRFFLNTVGLTVGIATNYKTEEKLPENHGCEPLTSLVQNKEDAQFCVHGTKVKGQPRCTCTPGNIGERCDVSVCENYCLQGDCSLNDAGLPKCRCNAGYSGYRCEVYACHGYCLNNGVCTLNEAGEPLCQCVGKHDGSRCEGVENGSCANKNQY